MNRLLTSSVAVCLLCVVAASADERADRVVADWKARQVAVKTVRYSITGTDERVRKIDPAIPGPVAKREGTSTQTETPVDTTAPRPNSLVCLLDLEGKRVRIEKADSGFDPHSVPVKRRTVNCYNGKQLQTAVPREENDLGEGNVDMAISKGNLSAMAIEVDLWPLLDAHGIVPTVNRPSRFDRLPFGIESDDVLYRSDATLSGRKCRVFRTEPLNSESPLSDELWVDTERSSAVLRHVYLQKQNPYFKLDVVFHSHEGHWLPQSWTSSFYRMGALAEISKYRVVTTEINPPVSDGDFVLPILPGTLLGVYEYPEAGKGVDPNRPAEAKYRVSETGEWVLVGRSGFTQPDGTVLPHPDERKHWRWIIPAVTAVALSLILLGRKLRRPRERTVSP